MHKTWFGASSVPICRPIVWQHESLLLTWEQDPIERVAAKCGPAAKYILCHDCQGCLWVLIQLHRLSDAGTGAAAGTGKALEGKQVCIHEAPLFLCVSMKHPYICVFP